MVSASVASVSYLGQDLSNRGYHMYRNLLFTALLSVGMVVGDSLEALGEPLTDSIAQADKVDSSSNETWHPISYNKDRIAVAWVQLKSYEALNENSFRMNAKSTQDNGRQVVGRIDVNCKNKDFYFRPNGVMNQRAPWASIPEGSGVEALAKMYCKNTAAKVEWGYTPQTAYLWDAPLPIGDPANVSGEWIQAISNDEVESFYNNSTKRTGDVVIYAFYFRAKKGDRSAAAPQDTAKYAWVRNSCSENLSSVFYRPDQSVAGVWLPPEPGRPGGTSMITRRLFCGQQK